jgi:putative ABC transport system permease protein
MFYKYIFRSALRSLRSNASRSFLTILGIVIGIAAIILIASLGKGAQNLILDQIQGLGSRTIAVIPGREPTGPSDVESLFSDSLKERDLIAIQKKANVPTLGNVIPVVFGPKEGFFSNNSYHLTVFGGSAGIESVLKLSPEVGSFFTEDDVKSHESVVVIGAKVKEKLFGESDALGEKIKIKNHNFRVVGVLGKKGQVSFFNFDEIALIPYTTAQDYVFGIKYFHRFIVESDSDKNVKLTVQELTATLRENHNITDPVKDDFFIQTQADLVQRLGTITNVLTYFLAAVASISLFVAGIGIMNIMLVSVTERTREIGLRKAIGARERDILRQFLLEAVLLTGIGGVIGILLGAFLSFLISLALSKGLGLAWTFTFPIGATIIGLAVSAGIGLAFGIYPARQASKKSPIEALRYE